MGERAAGLIWPSSLIVALVRDLIDPDPCSFDHHGYCQAHGWLTGSPRCPHGRAKQFLEAVDEATGPVAGLATADPIAPSTLRRDETESTAFIGPEGTGR